jgi:hypothetical protein
VDHRRPISNERRRQLLAETSQSPRDPFADLLEIAASLTDALQLGGLLPFLASRARGAAPVASHPVLRPVPVPATGTERAA